jgi:hypothetical protein
MTSRKHIQAKLDFLYREREKIEATGIRIDPDLRKTYRFIGEEIQNLQMYLFEDEYQQFSDRLMEIFESDPFFSSKENSHDLS